MTIRLRLASLSVLAVLVVTSALVSAQESVGSDSAAARALQRETAAVKPGGPVPRRADGKPDLTGNWNPTLGFLSSTVILEDHPGGFGIQAGKSLIIEPPDGIIPYLPAALTERNRRRDDANGYEDQVGHCEFYSMGRIHQFVQEITFSGNSVIINATQHITRVIPLDRKEHLPSNIRLWLGDPIGRWDGDTLVVDTTNYNDRTRMALGGDFHSAEAHIVERFAMADSNTINWTIRFDDPKTYSRPWTMTSAKPMTRVRPVGNEIYDAEDTCHEGNVDLIHLKNVYDQAHGKDTPLHKK
jgi:hypothetical protein